MTEQAGAKPTVSFEDFLKLDLRVAKVLEVAEHPNADKLYVLKVDAGNGQPRQLLAGLKPYCAPEALLGRPVVVVTNLAPRKLRGLESQGMLLAATYTEQGRQNVVVLTTDQAVPPGSVVS
jgi:methionyl-tRNA synthetase